MVLTSQRCIDPERALQCGSAGGAAAPLARALRVLTGDDATTAQVRARGRDVVLPGACGVDVALVVLDEPIDDADITGLRANGCARGDHVRTVTLSAGTQGPLWVKRVVDHAPIETATQGSFTLAAAVPPGADLLAAGVALDEQTGELLGVVSTLEEGATFAYARADVAAPTLRGPVMDTVVAAMAQVVAGRRGRKPQRGPVDMGATCERGADCAAGACVTDSGRQYCSRSCSPTDHCPPHFRCKVGRTGLGVDVRVCTKN
jgi:hypothetical protein